MINLEDTNKTVPNSVYPIRRHHHRHNVSSRYESIKTLGKGTYGRVKLAKHKETNQLVAVKSIRKDQVKDSVDMRHIRGEMEIMSSIRHQHIIQIHEVFENQDKIVIVMEYAAGGELYECLDAKPLGFTDEEAKRFFRQIVSAVQYCHNQGIVHRDLKLENILLDKDNQIKIADFGLANSFKSDGCLNTFCGSPLYASPEIICGVPYRGPEVDSWSLGVLLYALVYGTMPFDGRNYQLLTKQITSGVFTKPPKHSDAHNLICWLLTVDPRYRATINDVAAHPWVGLDPETSPSRNNLIPAPIGIGIDVNPNPASHKPLIHQKSEPQPSQTPKSILKHKGVALPARPHSVPATSNLGESLADQLAAVCGFNTKDSLILQSSNAAGKRNNLRSRQDRESGYYSSPERMEYLHHTVSASEPTLHAIGESSQNCPALDTSVRSSWPNSPDHCSSLPCGMSTCGLRHNSVKQRYTSLSSDDGYSVGSSIRPASTYSDSSVMSSDSFDICTFDGAVPQQNALTRPVAAVTGTSRPSTLGVTPNSSSAAKNSDKRAPGALTPKSEKLERDLERILAPNGRRRRRHMARGAERPPQNPFLPMITDLNDNFDCKRGIDVCANIKLTEV